MVRCVRSKPLESVRDHIVFRQSFRSISRTEAQRRKARAFRLRHSQSLASLRQRLSQPMVLSTIQRLGSTTNLPTSVRFDDFDVDIFAGALQSLLELRPLVAAVGGKVSSRNGNIPNSVLISSTPPSRS